MKVRIKAKPGQRVVLKTAHLGHTRGTVVQVFGPDLFEIETDGGDRLRAAPQDFTRINSELTHLVARKLPERN